MIYLARHGQTEFNKVQRAQGRLDSELTPLGVAQAAQMGRLLRRLIENEPQVRLVSSPQGRAHRTATLIRAEMGLDLDIVLEPRIREVSMGVWDGMSYAEIEAGWPGTMASGGRWFFESPDGETLDQITARLAEWWAETRALSGVTIAVSHGAAGRVLRSLVGRLPVEEALSLPAPQDAVFRLLGDRIERIDCDPAPA